MVNLSPKLRFPEFSGNWKSKKLEEVGTVINGLTYSPDDIHDDGVLVLRSSNIKENQLSFNDNVYVNTDNYNAVKENDILICVRNGSRNLIGKNALITKEAEGVAFGAFMSVYRSELNKFVFQLFATDTYYKIIQENLGATINSINNSDLKKFEFYFPLKEEQDKIADFLSEIDYKINQLTKKKELLEQYKKGMMQKIFNQDIRFKDENGNDFSDWVEKKLVDIANKKSSNISANKIEDNFGNYIIYGASGILKKIDFYKEEDDYISIVKDGSGVGRLFYCKGQSSVLGTMEIIRPNQDIKTYFLYFLLCNIDFTKYITGSTIPHIYFKDYSSEIFRLPCIEEQIKIANFLSAIDDKIKQVGTQLKNTKEFKKGLLQLMFV
jgi:type I restriction enzyme S subunit